MVEYRLIFTPDPKGPERYDALKALVKETTGKEIEITKRDGRPVSSVEGIYLSLSHTDGALFIACSDFPVGADCERVKERNFGAVAKTFTEEERAYLSPMSADKFYCIWTMKESFFKAFGEINVNTVRRGELALKDKKREFILFDEKGIKCCVCVGKKEKK